MPNIGPGSYDVTKQIDRKIHAPTIPRDTQNRSMFSNFSNLPKNSGPKRNKGTIRDEYQESSEDEIEQANQQPGPGSYLKDNHISTFGHVTSQKPANFQFFGSSIERFKST